jgi:hypothetical protein
MHEQALLLISSPELVAERAKEFQFDEITLAGMHQPTNEWGQNLNGKTIDFQVVLETRENHPNFNKRVILVEGKQVAPISEKDYQLPIGTEGKGNPDITTRGYPNRYNCQRKYR